MKGRSQANIQDDAFPKIGAPAMRALNGAGYTRLSQLSKATETDLLKLHGLGSKAIRILREAMAAKGLAFKGE